MKFLRKTFVVLFLLGLLSSYFTNFPFQKVFGKTNLFDNSKNEINLNDEYINQNVYDLYEVEEKREENLKVFKMSDGSYNYYYYDSIIHYLDNDGIYQEIDTSLKEETSEYSSSSIDYSVKLPKKIFENKKIKLTYNDSKIEITYNNINKSEASTEEIDKFSSITRYDNILENVDLEYITTTDDIKENIILNKYIENLTLSFNIKLKNLSLIKENDYIYFVNNNEIIYTINPYFMYDKLGKLSYDINLNIIQNKEDEYTITIKPNNEWLLEANYPVIIDPTISYNRNSITNYFELKKFNKGNITSSTTSNIELSKYINSSTKEDTSLYTIMKLDISNLPDNLYYTNAQLKLYGLTDNILNETVTLSEITSDIEFNNIKGTSTYTTDYLSTQTHSHTTLYTFNITDALNRNLNKNEILFEFSPKDFSTNDIYIAFYGSSLSSYKPYITLNCFDTTGMTNYWTYHEYQVGNAGEAYINDFNGNLIIKKDDYINKSQLMSFSIQHYYNSSEANINIGYGNGWRISYSDTILTSSIQTVGLNYSEYYINKDGTGHSTYYKATTNDGEYVAEDGTDNILIVDLESETSRYKRTYNGEYIYTYDSSGLLNKIEKINKYTEEIYVDEKIFINYTTLTTGSYVISQVEDAVGNKAVFNYEDDLLSNITIYKMTEVNNYQEAYNIDYTYSSSYTNCLSRIKAYSKESTTCLYESFYGYHNSVISSLNESISNNLTNSLYLNYDSTNKKFDKVQYQKVVDETVINDFISTEIVYKTQRTDFINSDGYTTTYIFDGYGHTINIYDSDGYAQFYKYNSENTNKMLNNKLVYSSDVVYNTYNLFHNHSFENYSGNGISGWDIMKNGGNVNLDYTNFVFGLSSLKVKSNSTTNPTVKQTIKLKGYQAYTLTAFVKVIENSGYDTGGAYIIAEAYDEEGNNIVSETINYVEPNDSFEYINQNFTVMGNADEMYDVTITLSTSPNTTAYFDNVSFDEYKNINDCRFNLLDDNSFENTFDNNLTIPWEGGSTITRDESDIFGKYQRNLSKNTTLKQTIEINPVINPTFTFGGFVNTYRGNASIRISLLNSITGSQSDYYTITYSNNINEYQYLLDSVTFNDNIEYNQIKFEVINSGNTSIKIDNLILYNDKMIELYDYNEFGKVKQIKTNEKTINIERSNGRDISSITYDNHLINYEKGIDENNSLYNFSKNSITANLGNDSTITNVLRTNYSENDNSNIRYSISGDVSKGFYTESYQYTLNNQYLSKYIDEFGNSTSFNYDNLTGLITSISGSSVGLTTNYVYNELEQLVSLSNNIGTITYTYNSNKLIETISTGYYEKQITYKFTYNEYNDIIKIQYKDYDDVNFNDIVTYTYYKSQTQYYTGLISSITYGDGYMLQYSYDNEERLSYIREYLPSIDDYNAIASYIYDTSGNISIFEDKKTNIKYYYNYDLLGNIESIIDSNDNIIKYTYDEDKTNLVVKIEYLIDGIDGIIEFIYDDYDSIKEVTYNENVLSLTNKYTENEYDPLGRILSKAIKYKTIDTTNDIINYNYEYYQSTLLSNQVLSSSDGSSNQINYLENLTSNRIQAENIIIDDITYRYEYVYSSNGNITSKTEYKIQNNISTKCKEYLYTYSNNMLTEEEVRDYTIDEENYTITLQTHYEYDNIGNIISMYRFVKKNEYSSLPSQIYYYYEDTKDPTKLTKYVIDSQEFTTTYKSDGTPLKYKDYNAIYVGGKLVSLSKDNIDMIKYTYDVSGNRIKKEVYNELTNTYDVTNYIYLENVLIGETYQDGTIIEYIYDDTEIIGFTLIQNNIETNYYYVKNIQGDIEKIVDNNKNIVATYTYDAYGNTISNNTTIANINPFRYRGYYFDQETNLYYCISRYYDSKITRFISRDDINYLDVSTPLGMNLYSYCINNPIRYIDYIGFYPICYENRFLLKNMLLFVNSNNKYKFYYFAKKNNLSPHSLDVKGIPNSVGKQYNPDGTVARERVYGDDGNAVVDHDYQDNHPEIGPSHDHKWDWSGSKPERGDAENPNKISNYGMPDNETTIVVVSMSCLAIFVGGFGGGFNNLMFAKDDALFCWW